MSHECHQEGFLGEVKEFIANSKGLKFTMFSLVGVMAVQVGTFLFLWGSLTTTVNSTVKTVGEHGSCITDNTRNIDKILAKFELIQVIKGMKGDIGLQGESGKDANGK